MRYVVVGGGAIGGTVAAGLVRDGHDVLVCDADPEHVAAINRDGLTIEGPVEEYTVHVPAVAPDELPAELDHVLLAVKAHHTGDAMRTIAPRLAPNGYVVSLQNGMNEPEIVAAVGAEPRRRRVRQLRRRRASARGGSCVGTGPPSGSASSTAATPTGCAGLRRTSPTPR